jgi:hypothetical protein
MPSNTHNANLAQKIFKNYIKQNHTLFLSLLLQSLRNSFIHSTMNRSQDQRSRPAKPATIHTCALSGDLIGLQKLLRDNPSLLNDKNPVVRLPFSFPFILTKWAISKISSFFVVFKIPFCMIF